MVSRIERDSKDSMEMSGCTRVRNEGSSTGARVVRVSRGVFMQGSENYRDRVENAQRRPTYSVRGMDGSGPHRCKIINEEIRTAGRNGDAVGLWSILTSEGKSFDEVNISTWILQCAKQTNAKQLFLDPRFIEAKTAFLSLDGECKYQVLSNIAYAYTLAEVSDEEVFNRITEKISEREDLRDFSPHAIGNILCAYAKIGFFDRRVFCRIAQEIQRRESLSDFNAQDLSDIAWAYAKAGFPDPAVFSRISAEIQKGEGFGDCKAQDFSKAVWAYATAGFFDPAVFSRVALEFTKRIDLHINSHELSNIVWAYATAGFFDPAVFSRIAQEIQRKGGEDFDEFIPQAFSNIVWAYAKAGFFDPAVFSRMAEEIRRRETRSFHSQELSNIVWAYATAGFSDEKVFDRLAEEMKRRDLSDFTPQALSNTAWAYAVYCACLQDPKVEARIKEIVRVLLERASSVPLVPKECSQVALASAFFQIDTEALDAVVEDEPVSDLEKDIKRFLPGFTHQQDLGRACAHHRADFYRETDRVVVEVDGSFHFHPKSRKPLPQTILRNAILQKNGLNVKSIFYMDWRRLRSNEEKEAYIANLLR